MMPMIDPRRAQFQQGQPGQIAQQQPGPFGGVLGGLMGGQMPPAASQRNAQYQTPWGTPNIGPGYLAQMASLGGPSSWGGLGAQNFLSGASGYGPWAGMSGFMQGQQGGWPQQLLDAGRQQMQQGGPPNRQWGQ